MDYFCKNCFADEYLQDLIENEGEINTCHCCNNNKEKCIDSKRLRELMKPVLNLYQTTKESTRTGAITKNVVIGPLWDFLTTNWKIFKSNTIAKKIIRLLYADEDSNNNCYRFDIKKNYQLKSDFGPDDTLQKRWSDFCDEIKKQKRFFPKNPLKNKECNKLFDILTRNINPLDKFFRVRISEENKQLPPSEMGKPPYDKSKNGRVNPVGIPCLYLASDENTAIAETRPSVGSSIAVGVFCVNNKLKMLDLRNSVLISPFKYGNELSHIVKYIFFLSDLSKSLSKPIKQYKEVLEYLPTQFLSEYIKFKGFDGILYDSSVSSSGGFNIALFDEINKLACKCVKHYKIDDIIQDYKKSEIKCFSGSANTSITNNMKMQCNT